MRNSTNIQKNEILNLDNDLLSILLKDHTTQKNIIWATDNYKEQGKGFNKKDNIEIENITGKNRNIIKPRIKKSKKEQEKRIKEKAEVYTPSWLCNKQNNLIDAKWFGKKNIFNITKENSWKTINKKIEFPTKTGKNIEDYIEDIRLEITCGEAPYLVSRYDNVTGKIIKVKDRIGLLDRKLRVINENFDNEKEWNSKVEIAYKSIYAYEYQGDNLLIARENLLFTYLDNYLYKFNKKPDSKQLIKIAKIISWNIWQMDGIKFVVPESCKNQKSKENNKKIKCLGCENNDYEKHNGKYCKIKDWKNNKIIKAVTLLK